MSAQSLSVQHFHPAARAAAAATRPFLQRPAGPALAAAASRRTQTYTSSSRNPSSRVPTIPAATPRASVNFITKHPESETIVTLKSAALSFIRAWSLITKSDSIHPEALDDLQDVVAEDVSLTAAHPLGPQHITGIDNVLRRISADVDNFTSLHPNKVLLLAADEVNSVVFCLLECDEMGSVDDAVSLAELEMNCMNQNYGIMKLQFRLDDSGTAKITGVAERMQMGPADACLLSMLYPGYVSGDSDSGVKQETARSVAMQMSRTWGLPREQIKSSGMWKWKADVQEAALQAIRTWCNASNSGSNEEEVLASAVDVNRYTLWDPYGVLPTVCGMKDGAGNCTFKGIQAETPSNCIVPFSAVVQRLSDIKENHHLHSHLIDSALCSGSNCGFSHVCLRLRRLPTVSSAEWRNAEWDRNDDSIDELELTALGHEVRVGDEEVIEALSLHIFGEDGKMITTWTLRDPLESEKEMLQLACTTRGM